MSPSRGARPIASSSMQSFRKGIHALSAIALLCVLQLQPAAAQYGSSYLGCFSFSRMLYLKGVEGVKAAQYTKATIGSCFSDCRQKGYSLSIVGTDFRCWCAMQTPPPGAQMDESACQPGSSKGALVFYHYEGILACRVQELPTDPTNFITSTDSKSNQGSVTFDSLAQTLSMSTSSSSAPARVLAKFPAQLYGQFEVSARVSVHPAVVTSIDIQEDGTSGAQAKAPGSEDISLQFFNTTAAGIGKNVLLGTASRAKSAASALEFMLKPTQYKTLGGLKQEENLGNAWVTYTINWQSDRVTWAINGVPVMTKWRTTLDKAEAGKLGQTVSGGRRKLLSSLTLDKGHQQKRQQQRKQQAKVASHQQSQQQQWEPPNEPAQLSFGIRWNPKAESTGQQQQQHPAHSSFMEARHIVCDKARVRGDKGPVVPSWFLLPPGWQVQQLGGVQQQQQQQQKQQKPKQAQGNKKGHAADAGKQTQPGKSGGNKANHNKQQQQQHKGQQQQEWQPDAYAKEQQKKHNNKPAGATDGKHRRDKFAEAEIRQQQQQQQQKQKQQQKQQDSHHAGWAPVYDQEDVYSQGWQQEEDVYSQGWQEADEDDLPQNGYPSDSASQYASLFGQHAISDDSSREDDDAADTEKEIQQGFAQFKAQQRASTGKEGKDAAGVAELDRVGVKGSSKGTAGRKDAAVRAHQTGTGWGAGWKWSYDKEGVVIADNEADVGASVFGGVEQLQGLSWAEDEPDWPDRNEEEEQE